ncbi:hypothetical protein [Hansschlegelia sp.]|uniref:hypothetical protein n=1 Tax=Hansschlegelia sp. TaxID=2041892 RepID=UPI002D139AFC|nr:hypothetical protein [Hansschlegelia sp.]HVI28792.1 hypothetical protein [Hansschlegelia sp.]
MKFSLLLAICGLATCAPAVAQEKGADFRYRGWIGAPLPNDADKGCAMAAQARGGVFVAYANATGAFKIGVGGDDFELEPGKETIAAVVFDDGPPIVLKGVAATKAMALFEPINFPAGGRLEPLVESSRSVRMTFAGRYLRARLNGSSRALRMLRDCATAPQPVAPSADANGNAASGPEAGERAADFGFLRQGMDATQANTRLLDAGWQVEEATGAASASPGAPNPPLEALRARGIAAQSCEGAPPSCVIAYADAYGNALRVTAVGEEDPKVKNWRFNPPDEPNGAASEPDDR